ncbi:hypothetical protein IAQ61_000749 [Plenodomus lingam]|uniref:uncharacterized protein n=1 Tax=Leptosphaeria maculans TaxID=5022 RepID=UPI00331AA2A4|nr:hypothetical protein IAQ61_000749 [Plenodomus lingam]
MSTLDSPTERVTREEKQGNVEERELRATKHGTTTTSSPTLQPSSSQHHAIYLRSRLQRFQSLSSPPLHCFECILHSEKHIYTLLTEVTHSNGP